MDMKATTKRLIPTIPTTSADRERQARSRLCAAILVRDPFQEAHGPAHRAAAVRTKLDGPAGDVLAWFAAMERS